MELLFTTTLLPSVLFPCRLNALAQEHLIDLLHLGALIVLERREVIIVLISVVFLSSVVNAETKLDHAVDAASKGDRLIQGEARCEQRGVKQQPDKVLDSLVVLVLVGTCTESVDDGVYRVHLHSLLRCHVAGHGAVLEGLSLHDALHVADQPYSPVTRQHGEVESLSDTTTFSALSPSTSFMSLQRFSQAAFFSSNSFFSSSVFSSSRPSLVTAASFLPSYSLSC